MRDLFHAIDLALAIYTWLLLAGVVVSWLIGFNQIDDQRPFVGAVRSGLGRVAEPVLRPLRALLPGLGGVDISLVVAIVTVAAVRYVIALFILPKLL
ncbi:MAG TPA: YggT family protein [Xanthobacteraceae bacterium]|jgi:YggT family protein